MLPCRPLHVHMYVALPYAAIWHALKVDHLVNQIPFRATCVNRYKLIIFRLRPPSKVTENTIRSKEYQILYILCNLVPK